MFLIKHIVSHVRTLIMNSSSVCEKAAVEGTMGNRRMCCRGRNRHFWWAHTEAALRKEDVQRCSLKWEDVTFSCWEWGENYKTEGILWERKESIVMQTCIEVEVVVGVVSMETKREGEWRILLSLLLPERSKVWFPLYCQHCEKVWFFKLTLECIPQAWLKKLHHSHQSTEPEAAGKRQAVSQKLQQPSQKHFNSFVVRQYLRIDSG